MIRNNFPYPIKRTLIRVETIYLIPMSWRTSNMSKIAGLKGREIRLRDCTGRTSLNNGRFECSMKQKLYSHHMRNRLPQTCSHPTPLVHQITCHPWIEQITFTNSFESLLYISSIWVYAWNSLKTKITIDFLTLQL